MRLGARRRDFDNFTFRRARCRQESGLPLARSSIKLHLLKICVRSWVSASRYGRLNGIVGLGGRNRLAAIDTSLPGKQMRAFREYDQESGCVAARQTARALRKRIANCKPIDRLAILHVLRVECSGASIKRSRDDE
jgi:hypothetical protein